MYLGEKYVFCDLVDERVTFVKHRVTFVKQRGTFVKEHEKKHVTFVKERVVLGKNVYTL